MRLKLSAVGLFLSSLLLFTPLYAELHPIPGPTTGKLGTIAEITVPDGYEFYAKADMKEFMEKSQNFYSEDQMGVLRNPSETSGYLVLFSFDEVGYIKDAASEKLDADKMWKDMVDNNTEANKERKEKGWTEMEMVGWLVKPNYNAETQRLEWAETLKDNGKEFVNFNTRILGRKGVMRATLVPHADLDSALSGFNSVIKGYDFTSGSKYSEWTTGDKVADFGLAALVVGGAGALAAKTGLLGKLWGVIAVLLAKAGKLLILAFLGVGAFFKKLFSGKSGGDPPSSVVK